MPAPLVKVSPTTPTPEGAHFGFRFAVWENLVVTGAWPESGFVGAAYIFDSDDWSQVARLEAPIEGGYFGTGVGIWEDIVVCGRVELDFWRNPGNGSAVVFKRGANGYDQIAVLRASDGVPAALFGTDVGVYQNLAAVGAPMDTNEDGEVSGAVYLYRDWVEVAKLVPPERLAHRYYGLTLSLDDSYLFVGASDVDVLLSHSAVGNGAVFVYDHSGNEVVTLEAPDGYFGDEFGAIARRDGDLVVVGAPRAHGLEGAVYLFDTNWQFVDKLTSPGGQYFGQAVDVKGDTILVGSNVFGLPDGDPGRAEVFMRNSSWDSWARIQTTSANDFGTFVKLTDDGLILVSATNARNDDGVASGCVFVYNIHDSFTLPDSSSSSSKKSSTSVDLLLIVVCLLIFCLITGVAIFRRRQLRAKSKKVHATEEEIKEDWGDDSL